MSDLTEDQKRAFGDRITEMYGDPDTLTALQTAGSGLDPSKRLAKLQPKQAAAIKAENDQTKQKAALRTATEKSVAATEDYYGEASGAAGALADELGPDDPLSQEIHRIRPGMSNVAARGPRKTGDSATGQTQPKT